MCNALIYALWNILKYSRFNPDGIYLATLKYRVQNFNINLHKTWSLCNIIHKYLLFWPAFIWQIFLEKKNSAQCLLKPKWQIFISHWFFSHNISIRQMKLKQVKIANVILQRSKDLVLVHVSLSKISKCLFEAAWSMQNVNCDTASVNYLVEIFFCL